MRRSRPAIVLAAGLVGALASASLLNSATVSSSATVRGPFFADLRGGSAEIPPGDPDGRGAFSAVISGRTLCYGIQVANIGAPNAAHIHRGGAGVVGPIVVTLNDPAAGSPGASSGCVRIGLALANQIRANPGGFYVNVHNAGYPGGAVRGQLER